MSLQKNVIILGAGGAGMMCAIEAGRRGRSVLLIDHAKKIGGKILISGGGRCNFTNLGASPANYVSQNPHFCKSALSRFPSSKFIEIVDRHGVDYHEKKLGQLFCDHSAQAIVDVLKTECDWAGAEFLLDTKIERVETIKPLAAQPVDGNQALEQLPPKRFKVITSRGDFDCDSLVVATGGLSLPKIGATGIGYEIATQFGHSLVERAPALDGFVWGDPEVEHFGELAGLSIDVRISCRDKQFRENILFTHSGLSGPAALQGSLHWYPGDEVRIDLIPGHDTWSWLMSKKRSGSRAIMRNLLSELLPARFCDRFCAVHFPTELPLAQLSDKALQAFCDTLHAWTFKPSKTVGYSKAEVTRGGVNTDELSSKTLESQKVPGLHFIGEVVDVTGWLGGYNYQWAWASGWAAGQVV